MNARPFDGATKGFPGPRPDVFRNCRLSVYSSTIHLRGKQFPDTTRRGVSEKFNWLGGWIGKRRRRRSLSPPLKNISLQVGARAVVHSPPLERVRFARKGLNIATHPTLSLVSFQIAFSVPFPPSGKRMFRRAINR